MNVLTGIQPEKVFFYFEQLASIPHGSGNTQQISDYLTAFARERGLAYRQDERGNVIIWQKGTPGYETSAPVILQGHMDMVTVQVDGCEKDMEREGLDLRVDGDDLLAEGTSLGGDDGIAVAYALAILDDPAIPHPPLEAVFTVDEEIGMLGADFMDMSDLKGRLLLNLDSEDEGIFTVSCAGGATAVCELPCRTEWVYGNVLHVELANFTGGHSGVEIDKGRGNAIRVMGRLLFEAYQEIPFHLLSVSGGEKDNAIPKRSCAYLMVTPGQTKQLQSWFEQRTGALLREYRSTDPKTIFAVALAENQEEEAFTLESTRRVLDALTLMPEGIQRMSPEVEGLVQTSLNLGILETRTETKTETETKSEIETETRPETKSETKTEPEKEQKVVLSWAVRSSSEAEKTHLLHQLQRMTELLGGSFSTSGVYPGWAYREDSRLREVMVTAYREQYGAEPVVEGIHAGLECGIFASRLENLDAVSIGPQMQNVHTAGERLSIASTERTWRLVLRTLELLK